MSSISAGSPKKVENIIGRSNEQQKFWKILENQSLHLASHRRMGKTCILKKMCALPPDGWIGVEYFVQGKTCPEEFVFDLRQLLIKHKVIKNQPNKRVFSWIEKNLTDKDFGSFKIPSFKGKWKDLLIEIIGELVDSNTNIAIMIDEFPLMLWGFMERGKADAEEAMELLDVLRTLRETHEAESNVRFVLCGSIGMNVVLTRLKKDFKYMGEALNNMKYEKVLEMNEEDAKELTLNFLGRDKSQDQEEIVDTILKESGRIPYYIEMIFDHLQNNFKEPTVNNIKATMTDLLNDTNENAKFSHFAERIDTYYEKEECAISDLILNFLAKKADLLSENDIINAVKTQEDNCKDSDIKKTLTLLWNDLYINREIINDDRHYCFKFSVSKRWWKINRA